MSAMCFFKIKHLFLIIMKPTLSIFVWVRVLLSGALTHRMFQLSKKWKRKQSKTPLFGVPGVLSNSNDQKLVSWFPGMLEKKHTTLKKNIEKRILCINHINHLIYLVIDLHYIIIRHYKYLYLLVVVQSMFIRFL